MHDVGPKRGPEVRGLCWVLVYDRVLQAMLLLDSGGDGVILRRGGSRARNNIGMAYSLY